MLSYPQRPKPLSEAALRSFITKALEKGWIRESWHSEVERSYRNISYEDVLYGLEFSDWVFAAPPNYDEKHKNWEYLIKTQDLEGEELQLKVAAKIDDKTLIIISKF